MRRFCCLAPLFDGQPNHCNGGNEEYIAARLRIARNEHRKREPGGTVFLYSGTAAMVQVGDPTYAADTQGFSLGQCGDQYNLSEQRKRTRAGGLSHAGDGSRKPLLLGNSNQTGITLDGTGNYTGGTFFDDEFNDSIRQ